MGNPEKEGSVTDWAFIREYLPMYQDAAILTVRIGFLGIAISIVVGLLCSAVQYFKVPVLRAIVAVYIEFSRNTPLLVFRRTPRCAA